MALIPPPPPRRARLAGLGRRRERHARMSADIEQGVEGYGVVVADSVLSPPADATGGGGASDCRSRVYLWDEAGSNLSHPDSGPARSLKWHEPERDAPQAMLSVLLHHLVQLYRACRQQRSADPAGGDGAPRRVVLHLARGCADTEEGRAAVGRLLSLLTAPPGASRGKMPCLPGLDDLARRVYFPAMDALFAAAAEQEAEEETRLFGASPALAAIAAIERAESAPKELLMVATQRAALYMHEDPACAALVSSVLLVEHGERRVRLFSMFKYLEDALAHIMHAAAWRKPGGGAPMAGGGDYVRGLTNELQANEILRHYFAKFAPEKTSQQIESIINKRIIIEKRVVNGAGWFESLCERLKDVYGIDPMQFFQEKRVDVDGDVSSSATEATVSMARASVAAGADGAGGAAANATAATAAAADPECCAVCGKASAKLLTCTRCRARRFCSRECQARDWKSHKPNCFPEFEPANETLCRVLCRCDEADLRCATGTPRVALL